MDSRNSNIKILSHKQISHLNIPVSKCNEWIRQAFIEKSNAILKPKISLKPSDSVFFNTMPVAVPSLNSFGAKIVSRFPHEDPALTSQIFLYDLSNGNMEAIIDGTWITAMRTGAVAALSVKEYANDDFSVISMLGLGNTARASLLCLAHLYSSKKITVRLLSYKNHAELFIKEFSNFPNLDFEVIDNTKALITNADVVISCITVAKEQIGQDSWYKKGVVVIPVHTLGFQNCDLFFDKVFVDDIGHVKDFKYFNKFKYVAELSETIIGEKPGRTSKEERILCYNIGIALHDIFFAKKILDLTSEISDSISLINPDEKFWLHG